MRAARPTSSTFGCHRHAAPHHVVAAVARFLHFRVQRYRRLAFCNPSCRHVFSSRDISPRKAQAKLAVQTAQHHVNRLGGADRGSASTVTISAAMTAMGGQAPVCRSLTPVNSGSGGPTNCITVCPTHGQSPKIHYSGEGRTRRREKTTGRP